MKTGFYNVQRPCDRLQTLLYLYYSKVSMTNELMIGLYKSFGYLQKYQCTTVFTNKSLILTTFHLYGHISHMRNYGKSFKVI